MAVLGHEAQWLKSAGALAVVLHEVRVVVHAIEEHVRNGFVATRGEPRGAEVTAADMGADDHVGGLADQGGVDQVCPEVQHLVRVIAAATELLAYLGVADEGQAHVIQLQVRAAGIGKRLDRLAVGEGQIMEHRLNVRIGALVDDVTPVARGRGQHRRGRNGEFRRAVRVGLQELEVLDHRVPGEVELPGNGLNQLGRYADQFLLKISGPGGTAALAIRDAPQADSLLPRDHPLDGPIFHLPQCGSGDFTGGVLGAGIANVVRAQQTANLIRTERSSLRRHRRTSVLYFLWGRGKC